MKRFLSIAIVLILLSGLAAGAGLWLYVKSGLPQMITVADYHPLLVSEAFDRNGNKVYEWARHKRTLLPYDQMPQKLIQAFVSAEDSSFFRHEGLNYLAMLRAFFANLKAGRKVQGGSTITQQVARSLMLNSEKTYLRKIREVLLSQEMEKNLKKEEILYLYLNEIFLGATAYGVEAASQIYFRKSAKDLTVPECAILAGLPQAPSSYNPLVYPQKAKERQRYVLARMAEEGYITAADAKRYVEEPVRVYNYKNYDENAPFYFEAIRRLLVEKVGEKKLLEEGLKVYTGLDIAKQKAAQAASDEGLRQLDKRQGFRGALKNLDTTESVAAFLLETRDSLLNEISPEKILRADGTFESKGPLNLTGKDAKGNSLPNIPAYIKIDQIVKGVVTKVDDDWGLVQVRFAESKGLIDFESMKWARKPDPNVRYDVATIKKPSEAVKAGDVIWVKVIGKTFTSSRIAKTVSEWRKKNKVAPKAMPPTLPDFTQFAFLDLEQEPVTETALVSIDQKTGEVIAYIGGTTFGSKINKYDRAIQAKRQTGSSFKSFVYAAALDKNYTPSTPLLDVPLVYEEADKSQGNEEGQDSEALATKKWKPENHSKSFSGEVLFRTALIRSLNVPTVKVIENIGVDWVATYARRIGIFSPLNMDFTLALGSSGVTVYEMTRAFAVLGRLGQRVSPLLVHKVVDHNGKVLAENLTVDDKFEKEQEKINEELEAKRKIALSNEPGELPDQPGKKIDPTKLPPIFFADANQLIKPQTAYVTTTMLQGVIEEAGGTGGAARALGRPAAGKTGSTSGYYDAWFIGYTADIVTGVWVGFDQEKSLGKGEVGGRAALPIWLDYMKEAHEGLPTRSFQVPDGVVFANIDGDTGRLASATSKTVVRQAFIEGTEPSASGPENSSEENQEFYKEDLSQ